MLLRRGARRPRRLLTGTRVTAISHVRPMDLTSNALVFTWSRYDLRLDDRASELRRVALRGGRATILAKEIDQEGFGDHANSANATPDETIWVHELVTPCIETRIVVDRHGQRRMTTPTPRDIRALARDGSTLYAITSAPLRATCPPTPPSSGFHRPYSPRPRSAGGPELELGNFPPRAARTASRRGCRISRPRGRSSERRRHMSRSGASSDGRRNQSPETALFTSPAVYPGAWRHNRKRALR